MAPTMGAGAFPALSDPQELFINGEYRAGSETFPVKNPMTGETIYSCASATVADCAAAIDGAHAAYAAWSRTGPSARRAIFLRAADIMDTYLDEPSAAAAVLRAEVSATAGWVALNVRATAGLLRETAGLVTHIKGEVVPADRPGTTILVERQAVGVVFAVAPWNAPVNLTARAIASPAGVRQHGGAQAVRVLAQVAAPGGAGAGRGWAAGRRALLPALQRARAPELTEFAVKHPRVLRVNFTGSDRVGRIIAGWAATCLKQCVLELGGKAPVLVLADADLDDAADAVVFGAMSNAGQVCMSTERVIVHRSVAAASRSGWCGAPPPCGPATRSRTPPCPCRACSPLPPPRACWRSSTTPCALAPRCCSANASSRARSRPSWRPTSSRACAPTWRSTRDESFGPVLFLSEFDTRRRGRGPGQRQRVLAVRERLQPRHPARPGPRPPRQGRQLPHQRAHRLCRGHPAQRRHRREQRLRPLWRHGRRRGLHRAEDPDAGTAGDAVCLLTADFYILSA